jgi:hypothetical protein
MAEVLIMDVNQYGQSEIFISQIRSSIKKQKN